MGEKPDFRSLMSSSLGTDLEVGECEALAEIMTVRRLPKGDTYIDEGTTDHSLQVLVSGKIEISQVGPDGRSNVVHIMQPGEYSGVMGFVDGVPRTGTLRALNDCELYNLERGAFEAILESHPRIAYHIMRGIVRNAYSIIDNINRQAEQLSNYFFKTGGRY